MYKLMIEKITEQEEEKPKEEIFFRLVQSKMRNICFQYSLNKKFWRTIALVSEDGFVEIRTEKYQKLNLGEGEIHVRKF